MYYRTGKCFKVYWLWFANIIAKVCIGNSFQKLRQIWKPFHIFHLISQFIDYCLYLRLKSIPFFSDHSNKNLISRHCFKNDTIHQLFGKTSIIINFPSMLFPKILTHIVLPGPVVRMTNPTAEVSLYVFDGTLGLLDYSCVFMCSAHLQGLTNSCSMQRIQNYPGSAAHKEVSVLKSICVCAWDASWCIYVARTDVKLPTDFIPNKV